MESWTLDYSSLKRECIKGKFWSLQSRAFTLSSAGQRKRGFLSRLTAHKVSLGLPLKFPATFPNRAWNQLLGAKMLIPWPDPRVAISEASGPTESHQRWQATLGWRSYITIKFVKLGEVLLVKFCLPVYIPWFETPLLTSSPENMD